MCNLLKNIENSEIINSVVDNFMPLTKIPRASHHEEKISNYIVEWAKEQGLNPKQDSMFNVMVDIPATKGMENKPCGILQAHMDMVVAVKDGKQFNPLTDTINVIRDNDENTLKAEGTSLGADDGCGVAIIMSIVQNRMEHGPLRVIITVDEEDGMGGAFNIDKSWLKGCSYLINIDNEVSDEVLVSTASANSVRIEKKIPYVEATRDLPISIEIYNLKGGHSGIEIGKGRINGIICLAEFLNQIGKDIQFEIASFEGGTASNAIPTKANATLVINSADRDLIEQKLKKHCDSLNVKDTGIEDEIKFSISKYKETPKVVTEQEKKNIIQFATEIIDGVYTWSENMEELVESSSNLGILRLDENGLSISTLIRSSSPEKEKYICEFQLDLSCKCGYKAEAIKMADAWEYDPNSRLLELVKQVFIKQNGKEIKVSAVHAGVECGTFKSLNPDLDMISLGPDLTGAHTISETLYLNTIPKVWNLIEGIFDAI